MSTSDRSRQAPRQRPAGSAAATHCARASPWARRGSWRWWLSPPQCPGPALWVQGQGRGEAAAAVSREEHRAGAALLAFSALAPGAPPCPVPLELPTSLHLPGPPCRLASLLLQSSTGPRAACPPPHLGVAARDLGARHLHLVAGRVHEVARALLHALHRGELRHGACGRLCRRGGPRSAGGRGGGRVGRQWAARRRAGARSCVPCCAKTPWL